MDKGKVQQRCGQVRVASRELEYKRVREADEQLACRRKSATDLQCRVRSIRSSNRESIRFDAIEWRRHNESIRGIIKRKRRRNERSVVGVKRVVAAEELRIKLEAFGGNIQRPEVERFQLLLVRR